ncbi:MAG: hypothetical protein OSB29_07575 [Verrucomicrobiota bacterium]|nr:hypothetical protein [Verrucomicrobiota bacterium]
MDVATKSERIRSALPEDGLFDGQAWRIATKPFPLDAKFARELESLGRVLLKFYRAADLLYRHSITGKQPTWVADWLDQGKPQSLLDWQRHAGFKNSLPRVLRPDILLTENGWHITELDSVPGGIGLTGWLNETYAEHSEVFGGARGMVDGFAGIFNGDGPVHVMVSEESATYRPEMEWLCARAGKRFAVRDPGFDTFSEGDAAYRFFELFDLENVSAHAALFEMGAANKIQLTPPPKAHLEEKMLFALFWNRNLREFWQRELGGKFMRQLEQVIPRTWVVDPTPLPPHAALPGLELTDWRQLGTLSQKERQFVLKLSGFNERAWGARSVRLGNDLSQTDWAAAVSEAIAGFGESPWILQRFEKPRRVQHEWFDFGSGEAQQMPGRVRLCPYYFMQGEEEVKLGGVLATICPADKKIIHGMRDAILAPCVIS